MSKLVFYIRKALLGSGIRKIRRSNWSENRSDKNDLL